MALNWQRDGIHARMHISAALVYLSRGCDGWILIALLHLIQGIYLHKGIPPYDRPHIYKECLLSPSGKSNPISRLRQTFPKCKVAVEVGD